MPSAPLSPSSSSSQLRALVTAAIRERGPITVADYMELALYHPELGYYAGQSRRSGRDGDFFTSVDVGAVFGALLATQFAEMHRLLGEGPVDLVEAGAGDGRLMRDVLDAALSDEPRFYDAARAILVERSPAARDAHQSTLEAHAGRLVSSSDELPAEVNGIIFANELLDALPAHVVVMRPDGLREIHVGLQADRLVEREELPSTDRLAASLDAVGVKLEPGWRAEISLRAIDWVVAAASSLKRGFLVLIDYGHEAHELYSHGHASGTLLAFRRHATAPLADVLDEPGAHDLTLHVDLTAVQRAAESRGLQTFAVLDQTYFLMGLGAADRAPTGGREVENLKRRLALKTLLMPGGLGSTHKVMMFGRGVGSPSLAGASYRIRLT